MFSNALKFITGQRPWVPLAAMALLVCVCATLAWFQGLRLDAARAEIHSAQADLRAEQAAHNATAAALTQAQADIAALHVALAASENATAAVQGSLTAALSREAQALRDSAARKQILDALRTRPRTETEKQEVVDDETRRAAADRLNRPL